MSAHTPGPWRTSWSMAGCWLVYCSNDPRAMHHTHFSPKQEADARLIAAAPALLSIAQRWAAIDGGAWHVERHAAERAELKADTIAAIAEATEATGATP